MLFAGAALVALVACADDSARMPAAQPAIVVAPAAAAQRDGAGTASGADGPRPHGGRPGSQSAQAPSMVLAGHLASYRTAESAQAGWQQYVRQQPALQTLKPYFVPVTINGQPWIRLLAGDFPNAEEVNRFCNWARSNRMYCVPMPVAAANQPNAQMPRASAPAAAPAAPGSGTMQRQRQPRGTPQPAAEMPAPAAPPAQMPAAPAATVTPPPPAPVPQAPTPQAAPAANGAPTPLAPPLPPRRQPSNTGIPQ